MNKDLAAQEPSETPCTWCGDPTRRCGYEEYAAPCMSEQILALRSQPPLSVDAVRLYHTQEAKVRNAALEEAAQLCFDRRSDHSPGSWNDACDYCAEAILELKS